MAVPRGSCTTGYLVPLSVSCEQCGFAGDFDRALGHDDGDHRIATADDDAHFVEVLADRHELDAATGSVPRLGSAADLIIASTPQ